MSGHHHSHSHDDGHLPHGVYDVDYYHGRQKKKQLVYRLKRRTDEVERALRTYNDGQLKNIVDVGTADGLMMENLRQRMGQLHFVGIDYSIGLLKAVNLPGVAKISAFLKKNQVNG